MVPSPFALSRVAVINRLQLRSKVGRVSMNTILKSGTIWRPLRHLGRRVREPCLRDTVAIADLNMGWENSSAPIRMSGMEYVPVSCTFWDDQKHCMQKLFESFSFTLPVLPTYTRATETTRATTNALRIRNENWAIKCTHWKSHQS